METAHGSENQAVEVPVNGGAINGDLVVPESAQGVVLFAHGSGSGRFSPRNQQVAEVLQQAGLATLLVDLLTEEEEAVDETTAEFRFDIGFLARRLIAVTDWLSEQAGTRELRIGYFGASTGAAAALRAAPDRADAIAAIVSRGGRPDLAGPKLDGVSAPTLLIVGERDVAVLKLNQDALEHISAEKHLEIVPGATHLFEEPGALDTVAELARDWFLEHLPGAGVMDERRIAS